MALSETRTAGRASLPIYATHLFVSCLSSCSSAYPAELACAPLHCTTRCWCQMSSRWWAATLRGCLRLYGVGEKGGCSYASEASPQVKPEILRPFRSLRYWGCDKGIGLLPERSQWVSSRRAWLKELMCWWISAWRQIGFVWAYLKAAERAAAHLVDVWREGRLFWAKIVSCRRVCLWPRTSIV